MESMFKEFKFQGPSNTAPASAVPSVRELLFERPGLPGSH